MKASGGSVLLVPMITSLYRRLGRECEGGSETAELLLSSVAPLRQRGLELYVIINKATWLQVGFLGRILSGSAF